MDWITDHWPAISAGVAALLGAAAAVAKLTKTRKDDLIIYRARGFWSRLGAWIKGVK